MKQCLAVLLILTLLASLAACNTAPVVVSVEDETDTTVSTTVGDVEQTEETTQTGEAQKTTRNDTTKRVTTTAYVKKTRGTTTLKTRPSRTTHTYGTLPEEEPDLNDLVTLKQKGLLMTNGRVVEGVDGLFFMYSDCGITFTGTLQGDVSMDVSVSSEACWFNVVVDGKADAVKTVRLARGSHTLTLATGLKKGKHTIEVTSGTKYTGSYITFERLHYNGTLAKPAARALNIEFIGDSVTCSEGSIKEGGYTIDGHNSFYGYAALTARALNANLAVEAICGRKTLDMQRNFMDSSWNFADNPKDIVVINLGTNDVGWPDSVVSSTFKTEVKSLIGSVRNAYGKKTYIVWAYGMMFDKNLSVIKEAVEEYASANKDSRVLFCDMSSVKNTAGHGSHPNQEGHAKAATLLTDFLKSKCGA